MTDTYRSRVYTDRPAYADFDAPAKFEAIKSIIAKRLLEKQEGKKPHVDDGMRYCECGEIINSYQRYCDSCGQKIDWTKGE